MSVIGTVSRRMFLSKAAALAASGASLTILPNGYAAADGQKHDHGQGSQAHMSPVQGGHHTDDAMKKCIQLCQDCQALCTETVLHCLKLGGRHAAPDHIVLLLDCAQICETTAQYLLRESSFHGPICGLCADVCRQCAENCMQIAADDQILKQCAEMCRRCADSCERMSSKGAA
jgi:hypothetical protein